MNKKQWFILGLGLFISGWIIFSLRGTICMGDGDLLVACMVRRYAYAVPGLIMLSLGIVFGLLGLFEPKKK